MDQAIEKIRKAALLVAALDPHGADALLSQLPDEVAAQIRQASLELAEEDLAEQEHVIAEFCRLTGRGPQGEGGAELGGSLGARAVMGGAMTAEGRVQSPAESFPPSALLGAAFSSPAPDCPAERPFEFLQQADPAWLMSVLAGESAQTVAAVLSHLPQQQAARLLFGLPAAVQVEVVRRLAILETTDAESLRQVEQALRILLEQRGDVAPPRGGLAVLGDILAATETGDRDELLAQLRARDYQLADKIARAYRPPPAALGSFTFDDVALLDDESLGNLIRAAGPELILLSLAGAEERIVGRVLNLFPPHDAAVLQQELDHPAPTRLADVEAARLRLAALAGQLEAQQRGVSRRCRLSMAA